MSGSCTGWSAERLVAGVVARLWWVIDPGAGPRAGVWE